MGSVEGWLRLMGVPSGPFRARREGIAVLLSPPERELLVHLLGQLDELLDDGTPVTGDPLEELARLFDAPGDEAAGDGAGDAGDGGTGREAPADDPALARLLPDASPDDPEAAAEFRRFTESGLRNRKRTGARTAAAALSADEPVLGPAEAQALLKALTDLRLVLAERLGLKTDEDADRLHEALSVADPEEGGWVTAGLTYDALTWWQESLVGALTSRH